MYDRHRKVSILIEKSFSLSNSFTAVSNFLTLDKIACFDNLL